MGFYFQWRCLINLADVCIGMLYLSSLESLCSQQNSACCCLFFILHSHTEELFDAQQYALHETHKHTHVVACLRNFILTSSSKQDHSPHGSYYRLIPFVLQLYPIYVCVKSYRDLVLLYSYVLERKRGTT